MQILFIRKLLSVLFLQISHMFSSIFSPTFWRGDFLQTFLTHDVELCHFIFAYLSTNLCRDFFKIFRCSFYKFDTDKFLSVWPPPLNFFIKKHFLKLFSCLTNYAAEIKLWEFLKFFFRKKKIISQKSILDIFIFVHF